jgi:hypothetical protein
MALWYAQTAYDDYDIWAVSVEGPELHPDPGRWREQHAASQQPASGLRGSAADSVACAVGRACCQRVCRGTDGRVGSSTNCRNDGERAERC